MSYTPEEEIRLATELTNHYEDSKININHLFYSIRTHKTFDALKMLMVHPIYNINKYARRIAKIFKKYLEMQSVQLPYNRYLLQSEQYLNYMLESRYIAKLYQEFHLLNLSHYVVPHQMHNKKYLLTAEVFEMFKTDCAYFNDDIEAVIRGEKQSVASKRVLTYYSFLANMMKHTKKPSKSMRDVFEQFDNAFREIKLEIYYPADTRIATDAIVKMFLLEKDGKILMENLNYEKTRFGRLYAVGKLDYFLLDSDYSIYYFKRDLTNRLASVDTLRYYSLIQIDSELLTQEMLYYAARKTHGNDFVQLYYFWQRNSILTSKTQDTAFSLPNVLRIYYTREQNNGKVLKGMHAPLDALIYDWNFDKLEQIPLINVKMPIHAVECALFNSNNRFFNDYNRFEAIRCYLLSGFVFKNLALALHAFQYFVKTFSSTSSSSEKEQLRVLLRCDLFYVLYIRLIIECGAPMESSLRELDSSLLQLFDSGTYYQHQIGQLPQKLVEYILTDYHLVSAPYSMVYVILMHFARLKVANGKLGYSFKTFQTYSLLKEFFQYYCKRIYKMENQVLKCIPLAYNTELATAQFVDLYSKEIEYFNGAMDTAFHCKQKYLEIKLKDGAGKEEAAFVEIVEQLFPQLVNFAALDSVVADGNFVSNIPHQQVLRHIKHVVFSVGYTSFDEPIQKPIELSFYYQAEIFAACTDRLLKYVKSTYDMYSKVNQHYYIENFVSLHHTLLDILHAILKSYSMKQHTEITHLIQLICQNMQQFAFMNVDTSGIYEQYYQILFKNKDQTKKAYPAHRTHDVYGHSDSRAPRAPKTPEATSRFNAIIQQFCTFYNSTPAKMVLDVLSATMKFDKLTPLSIYLTTKMQHTIAIDKQADVTILFENSMPMSSLKILIKFLFKNTQISFDYINKLFRRSSTEGKSTILLYFYESVIKNSSMTDLFMQLVTQSARESPEAFLLFFGQVFANEEQLHFNYEIFTVCLYALALKPSPYLLNYAGFLGIKMDISDATAMTLFYQLVEQNKEAPYVFRYLVQIPIDFTVIEHLLKSTSEQTSVTQSMIFKTLNDVLNTRMDRFFNKELYISQLTTLYTEYLRWNVNYKLDNSVSVILPLEYFSAAQLAVLFTYHALDYVSFDMYQSQHQWEACMSFAGFASYGSFVQQVIYLKSGRKVDYSVLNVYESALILYISSNSQ